MSKDLEKEKQTVKATGLDLPFGTYELKKETGYLKIVDEKEIEKILLAKKEIDRLLAGTGKQ